MAQCMACTVTDCTSLMLPHCSCRLCVTLPHDVFRRKIRVCHLVLSVFPHANPAATLNYPALYFSLSLNSQNHHLVLSVFSRPSLIATLLHRSGWADTVKTLTFSLEADWQFGNYMITDHS